jgi:hypothetical protein
MEVSHAIMAPVLLTVKHATRETVLLCAIILHGLLGDSALAHVDQAPKFVPAVLMLIRIIARTQLLLGHAIHSDVDIKDIIHGWAATRCPSSLAKFCPYVYLSYYLLVKSESSCIMISR